mmetsp:Transcript_6956/g.11608  ORF Transcript_6956/g.11608 Transcript_6956/m.11608 type:complete len:298 (+) Transcript_6956:126-1019(+)
MSGNGAEKSTKRKEDSSVIAAGGESEKRDAQNADETQQPYEDPERPSSQARRRRRVEDFSPTRSSAVSSNEGKELEAELQSPTASFMGIHREAIFAHSNIFRQTSLHSYQLQGQKPLLQPPQPISTMSHQIENPAQSPSLVPPAPAPAYLEQIRSPGYYAKAAEMVALMTPEAKALAMAIKDNRWPLIPPEMLPHVEKLFRALDTNGDGVLSKEDFQLKMLQGLWTFLSEKMDLNNDGLVNQEEFLYYFILRALNDVNPYNSNIVASNIGNQILLIQKGFAKAFDAHLRGLEAQMMV